jgi:DNA-binding NarL/FixJ family response regulator
MRIMIAEDSGLLRQMLADALTEQGFDVVGQAADPVELFRLVDAEPPDAVVLDIRMPPTYSDEGMWAAEQIRHRHPSVGLLVLSHYAETAYAMRLLEVASHAAGYLVKDRVQDIDRLAESLRRVGAGEIVIDAEIVARLVRRSRSSDPLQQLTPGERQVLELMAEGRSNLAIAHRLSYSPKTVEKRISAIAQKLDLPQPGARERLDVNVRVLAVLSFLRAAT